MPEEEFLFATVFATVGLTLDEGTADVESDWCRSRACVSSLNASG